jgi:hypothetical protein
MAFHPCTRAAVTALASGGAAPDAVRGLIGHADVATTRQLCGGFTDKAPAGDVISAALEGSPDKPFGQRLRKRVQVIGRIGGPCWDRTSDQLVKSLSRGYPGPSRLFRNLLIYRET